MKINIKPQLGVGAAFVLAVAIVLTLGMLSVKLDDVSGIWPKTTARYLLGYVAAFLGTVFCGEFFFRKNAKVVASVLSLIFLIAFCGVVEFLSVSLFLVSAYCLGNLLLRWSFARTYGDVLFLYSCAIGGAFLILLFGALIYVDGNRQGLYFLYLCVPVCAYLLQKKTCYVPVFFRYSSFRLIYVHTLIA